MSSAQREENSCFFNDWLSKWRETYKPIKKSSIAKQMLRGRPFDLWEGWGGYGLFGFGKNFFSPDIQSHCTPGISLQIFSPRNQSPGYFFLKSPLPPPQKLNGRPLHRLNKEKINQPTHQSHLRLTINWTWETRKHKTSHIPSDRNQQLLLLPNTYIFILCLKMCMLVHRNGHQSMWIVSEVCNFLFNIYNLDSYFSVTREMFAVNFEQFNSSPNLLEITLWWTFQRKDVSDMLSLLKLL